LEVNQGGSTAGAADRTLSARKTITLAAEIASGRSPPVKLDVMLECPLRVILGQMVISGR
jgi:hypothetical protein